jgi:hypothetical protein
VVVNKNDPIQDERIEFFPRLSLMVVENEINLVFEYLWFGFKIKL